jgi:CRISPR-associated endonuclease Csn1
LGQKFSIGITGNKTSKFVEAAKGTNLFFAVYMNEDGVRSFSTIPLNIVIERLKQHLSPVPERNEKGDNLLFYLSPGDLVYVPMSDDANIDTTHPDRIYKFVSGSSYQGFFTPYSISNPILQTTELGSNNKSERAWSGEMIKTICIPLSVDRLGEIKRK